MPEVLQFSARQPPFGRPNITGEVKMHAISNAGLLYADVADQGAFYKSGSTNVVPTGANSAGAHLACLLQVLGQTNRIRQPKVAGNRLKSVRYLQAG